MFHISWYEQDDIFKIKIFSQQWYNQKCIWRNCFFTEYKILSREKVGILIQNILKRIYPNCFFQGFKTWLRRTLTFRPTKKMYALHIKRQTYKNNSKCGVKLLKGSLHPMKPDLELAGFHFTAIALYTSFLTFTTFWTISWIHIWYTISSFEIYISQLARVMCLWRTLEYLI